MRKNFSVQAKEFNGVKGAAAKLKNFALGRRAIVTSTAGGHNYGEVGTTFIISAFNVAGGSGTNYTSVSHLIPTGNNIPFSSFSVILEETPKEIEDKIKNLEKEKKSVVKKFDEQLKECKSKLRFLKENKTSEYGGNNVRYKRDLKRHSIRQFKRIHNEIIPWNTIRYIF